MTQDFFMGQLRLLAIGLISFATGAGYLTAADSSMIVAIITPAGLLLGPVLWSWWRNLNMKLVPSDSIAISRDTVANADTAVKSGTASITSPIAKVVGALLIAFALSALMPGRADAASLDPLAALKTFAIADIQAALDDANANNDAAGAQCWAALLPVVQNQQALTLKKFGVFTALQKARDAVRNVDMLRAGLGPIGDLKNKCAAVIVDTNTFLLRLGIVGAGAGLPF